MVLGETSRRSTRFWATTRRSSTTTHSFLNDADADVGDGDLQEAVHVGLSAQPAAELEGELALPFRCRWRVPLTRVHNPSGVLLLYRDQLDAQTPDQVMVYVKVYGSILISFIFP